MKNHLIAAAVAAAVAVPAAAQVTVYGNIGAGYLQTDTDGSGAVSVMNSGSSGNLGTSVLGFRGSEDLGGGLKASFGLEGTLGHNGTLGSSTIASNLFDRHAFAGIGGGFGTIKVGRTNNALKDVDGFGSAGVNLFDVDAASTNLSARNANQIRYESPAVAGVSINVTYSDNSGTSSSLAADSGPEVVAFNIRYAQGPLNIALAQGSAKALGATEEQTNTIIGASYSLGFGTVELAFHKNDVPSSTADISAVRLGLVVPLGGGLTVRAALSDQDTKGSANTDFRSAGAMIVKDFSKRTAGYVGIESRDLGTGGNDSTRSTIGIQHSF